MNANEPSDVVCPECDGTGQLENVFTGELDVCKVCGGLGINNTTKGTEHESEESESDLQQLGEH